MSTAGRHPPAGALPRGGGDRRHPVQRAAAAAPSSPPTMCAIASSTPAGSAASWPAGASDAAGAGESAVPQELTPELLLQRLRHRRLPDGRRLRRSGINWIEPRAARRSSRSTRFHVPRSLRKAIRRGGFELRIDHRFEAVIRACAAADAGPAADLAQRDADRALCRADARGLAHSVEVWRDGELAGGLYGLAPGRRLLRREHVLASARTPARSPWSTWSTACVPAASCCSTRNS